MATAIMARPSDNSAVAASSPPQPQRTEDDIINEGLDGPDGQDELMPGVTKDLEDALISIIVDEYERESYPTWRFQNRDVMQAEAFWKDLQYNFYDWETDTYRIPSLKDVTHGADDGEKTKYVTNLYRALGWTVISILGQRVPSTIFLPVDYTKSVDVLAAAAASDVAPIIERNNRVSLQHIKACYYLFTGGLFGGYVRWVADPEKFGYEANDEVGLASFVRCPNCGEMTPLEKAQQAQMCDSCGQPLPPDAQTQTIQVPRITGARKTAKGQETITLHGQLELRLPPWVQETGDCPYIGLVNEVHVSKLRQLYGKRAEKVQGGYGTSGAYDIDDRFYRLSLLEPSIIYNSFANTNLVTFKRYWIEPSSFYLLPDDDKNGATDENGEPVRSKRQRLLDLFPDGAYVAFVGGQNIILDLKNESKREHWDICRGMEGHGMFTPALGRSAVSIQKRLNELMNFVMEWIEYSAAGAGTFVNVGLMNVNALTKQRKAPGRIYPIRLPGGQSLANAVYESKPPSMAGEVFKHIDDLTSFGQQVTGAVPTVSGGTDMSLKPTTYLADREQALGKLFVPWQHLREFWARMQYLAVKCFADNRTDDEKYSLPSADGGQIQGVVRLSDLSGEFTAYPEVNDTFPRLWHDQQAQFKELMNSQDPVVQAWLGDAANTGYIKSMLGSPQIFIPGADDVKKQKLETSQMLMGQPAMSTDPATGQQQVIPSVIPDEYEDSHQEHEQEVKRWAVSNEGTRAKREQPMGYMNVIAHGKMHHEMGLMQAVKDQATVQSAQMAMGGGMPQPGQPGQAGPPQAAGPPK
jgi:hypothetical protein